MDGVVLQPKQAPGNGESHEHLEFLVQDWPPPLDKAATRGALGCPAHLLTLRGKQMIALVNANALRIPLKDESVHACVTSPPYYALRDYKTDGQLGLEKKADCGASSPRKSTRAKTSTVCYNNLARVRMDNGKPPFLTIALASDCPSEMRRFAL
jgi:hypothetical protein